MQLAVDVSLPNILDLISKMNPNELEEIKIKLLKKNSILRSLKKRILMTL